MIYGNLPIDLGSVDLNPVEMMFWLYCPVALPGTRTILPDNLKQYEELINIVLLDDPNLYLDHYIYLTAKTLYVNSENSGNRPGWHSDGFRTDDINYIWYDCNPTEFINIPFEIPDNVSCEESYNLMNQAALSFAKNSMWRTESGPYITYPNKHLLKLNESVIHRVCPYMKSGIRTFVKISVSKDKYDLVGNSINHLLNSDFEYKSRKSVRNHPASIKNG